MRLLRKNINQGLRRLTGYEIRRAAKAPAPGKTSKSKECGASKSRRRGRFPADYDEQAKATIRAVKPYTMTGHEKIYALILAVRHVADHKIPGDIVESGVWRGGSMQAAARTLLQKRDTTRDLHLFDTFEGMPPPGENDRRHDGEHAAGLLARSPRESKIWAAATMEDVRNGFESIPYPKNQIHYVQGMVEDTIPEHAPEQISVLRLDTDWYSSTRHELEHLYPRLSPGGVLLLDDYGWWQGSRQAVEEFLEETGARLMLMRMASGRIAVKP